MSRAYHDRGDKSGIPQYRPGQVRPAAAHPQGWRPSQNPAEQRYVPYGQPQAMSRPGPSGRGQLRQPQQPYPAARSNDYYNGRTSNDSDYDVPGQWPQPYQPYPGPPRSKRPQPNHPQNPAGRGGPSPRIAPANEHYHPPANVPSYHGSGEWSGDGYVSALPDYPPSQLPRPVQQSSQITHQSPHVPQQAAFSNANRRPPLGPPPSARRGPASYYPQVAAVHPIVEESDSHPASTRSGARNSLTSDDDANAVPIGVPSYYLENGHTPASEVADPMPTSHDEVVSSSTDAASKATSGQLRNGKAPATGNDPDDGTLVRQASLGKKSKPKLTTVKSKDKLRKDSTGDGVAQDPMPSLEQTQKSDASRELEHDSRPGGAAALAASLAKSKFAQSRDNLSVRTDNTDGSRYTADLTSPTSARGPQGYEKVGRDLPTSALAKEVHSPHSLRSAYSASPKDPRMQEIMESLERGGAITPSEDGSPLSGAALKSKHTLKTPMGGMSDRKGMKRPPRLNVDAVRDAEKRGSLSSLSDLIRRATRLASNLDRGRTASRLGMTWLDSSEEREKHRASWRNSGNISAILSSFPPPNVNSPTGSRGEGKQWSSRGRQHSALGSDSDGGEPRNRKCCGLPLWLFLLLLILGIVIIAVAIIVPVVVVVIPNQNKSHSSASCHKQLSCQNGGTNVLGDNGNCKCLCVNGYTGTTCGTAAPAGCTTATIGSTQDAVIGSALPPLLQGADGNFSIPLDGSAVLSLFSSIGANCNLQNQLVTFPTTSSSKRSFGDSGILRDDSTPTLVKRADSTTSADSAATSNGIVFETGSPTTASSAATSTATGSSSPSTADSKTIDFAGVTVLYVLQVSGQLDSAVSAQNSLQGYFQNPSSGNSQSLSLGNGYSCNLSAYSVSLANGTTVGGSSTT